MVKLVIYKCFITLRFLCKWLKGILKLHQDIQRHLQENDSRQWEPTSTNCTIVSSTGAIVSSQLNKPTASVVPVMKGYEFNATTSVHESSEPLPGVAERCSRVYTTSVISAAPLPSDVAHCTGTASMDVEESRLNGGEFCAPISDSHTSQSGGGASMPEILPVDNSGTFLPVSRDCTSVLSFSSNKENSISDHYPGNSSVYVFLCIDTDWYSNILAC